MKKCILFASLLSSCCATGARAQNIFPGTGNVGIGTAGPGANLDIETPSGTSTAAINFGANAAPPWGKFAVTRTDTGGNGFMSFMDGYYFSHMSWGTNGIASMVLNAAGWPGLYPTSLALNDLSGNTQIFLSTNGNTYLQGGNVGIGTTTPGAKLEVDGNVTLTAGSGAFVTYQDGTKQSTAWNGTTLGGDYAEAVDVLGDRTEYEPGDVIVIDSAEPGKFVKSDKAYSRLVAGVYSTKPGLVGRRTTADRPNKDAEVPMAMMGIVPTKVSAENGPIEPGDLLVSASTPGYVMKGTDASRMMGAVIGKALAPLPSGKGIIEALISLQ